MLSYVIEKEGEVERKSEREKRKINLRKVGLAYAMKLISSGTFRDEEIFKNISIKL